MSCTCQDSDRRLWRVVQYRSNSSHFSRNRSAASSYSEVRCLRCGHFWRTKAAYVETLARAVGDETYRLAENDHDLEGNYGPKATPLTRAEQIEKSQP